MVALSRFPHSLTVAAAAAAPSAAAAAAAPVAAAPVYTAIPALTHLGVPFKTSLAVGLTESETEYVVKCIKHVFAEHVVFQFDITNTLNDQLVREMASTWSSLVVACLLKMDFGRS
jgi:coatomer subunit gamma